MNRTWPSAWKGTWSAQAISFLYPMLTVRAAHWRSVIPRASAMILSTVVTVNIVKISFTPAMVAFPTQLLWPEREAHRVEHRNNQDNEIKQCPSFDWFQAPHILTFATSSLSPQIRFNYLLKLLIEPVCFNDLPNLHSTNMLLWYVKCYPDLSYYSSPIFLNEKNCSQVVDPFSST